MDLLRPTAAGRTAFVLGMANCGGMLICYQMDVSARKAPHELLDLLSGFSPSSTRWPTRTACRGSRPSATPKWPSPGCRSRGPTMRHGPPAWRSRCAMWRRGCRARYTAPRPPPCCCGRVSTAAAWRGENQGQGGDAHVSTGRCRADSRWMSAGTSAWTPCAAA